MLENQYTKDQILERYLNTVFFGNNAYGVQAAAEAYFGKTVDQLTFVEAAYLAGLVRSPSGYDPIDNPERSRARFAQVVDLLVDAGEMTEAEGQATLDTFEVPARVQTPTRRPARAAAHVLHRGAARLPAQPQRHPRRHVRSKREAALYRGGLEIHTTLIPGFQQMAEQARDLLPDTQQGFDAAMVSLDTQHRGDRGDGRRPRLRARRERGQHGARAPPDRVEPEDLHPRRRAPGRGDRPTTSSTASGPCVLPNPGDPSEPFEIRDAVEPRSRTRCGR